MSTQEKEALMAQNEKKIEEMTVKIIDETLTQEQLYARQLSTEPSIQQCAGCKCKNTKCLKLYCECLRNKAVCGPECQCNKVGEDNCYNNFEHKDERKRAIQEILKRNYLAFESKVSKDKSEHYKGCKCKASNCQKKYCECFERGVSCNPDKCKCENCKNGKCDDDTHIQPQDKQNIYISTVDHNEAAHHEEEKVLEELPSNEELMMEFGNDCKQLGTNATPIK